MLIGSLPVLVLARVYQRRWRYAGQRDYEAVVRAVVAIVLLTVAAVEVVRPVHRYVHLVGSRPVQGHLREGAVAVALPNGVIVLFALLSLVFLVGVRALARSIYERRPLAAFGGGMGGVRTVLIAGAGEGGRLVAREIMRNRELRLSPVGFLDDDPAKRRLRIEGLRVRGNTQADLPRILDESEPDEVIIAIPSAPGSTRARIVRECRERGIPVRTLPTVFELLQTRGALARQMREVRVEDVLGREPVHMELAQVGAYLAGQTVLVTGAGGSIGSELCRQIARVEPHRIVLLDHAEDNLFSIQRELQDERHVPASMLAAVLADCKEGERMREVFAEHHPTIVFHAAAYKHVPPDGGKPGGGRPQQRHRHPCGRPGGRRARRGALRARVHRQGRRTRRPSWGPPRRWPSSPWRPPRRASPAPATRLSASATCSAPRAPWSPSSAARSSGAAR